MSSLDTLGKIYIININDIDKGLEYLTRASSQNYSDSKCRRSRRWWIAFCLQTKAKIIKSNPASKAIEKSGKIHL